MYKYNVMVIDRCDTCDVYDMNAGLVAAMYVGSRQTPARYSCRDCEPQLFQSAAESDKESWLRGDFNTDVRMGYVKHSPDDGWFVVDNRHEVF